MSEKDSLEFGGTIREMIPSDLDAVLEIIATHDPTLRPLAESEIGDGFAVDPQTGGHYLVAQINERLVGVVGWIRDYFGVPDIRWLVWGYVLPDTQRRGVGNALFDDAERRLRELGIRKAYLDVGNADTHVSAVAFHKKRGYVQEGYLPDFWTDGDDLLIFGKRLM